MGSFLALSNKLLGYSPASKADAASPTLKPIPHELACLLGFKDHHASPNLKLTEPFHDMYSFGFLVGADERDLPEILEVGKMPFVLQDTIMRGVQVALIVGTFRQWQSAIKRACKPDADQMVRLCFDKVYLKLEAEGLLKAFDMGRTHKLPDQTFYLEDQRER
jgi:hypothetical protein